MNEHLVCYVGFALTTLGTNCVAFGSLFLVDSIYIVVSFSSAVLKNPYLSFLHILLLAVSLSP
ncbi:hypothetical protein MtrunA17_Chr4g0056961 [Medicago truncatula]|uniref:Transmembrane protein n=1 Tax=Medicago truncatula TaxID=3880 RepID=A0A396IGD9_MEDTR|nr:hypothetical protein MtrunA17_Chr4g0056961 [Medicago truncatula]